MQIRRRFLRGSSLDDDDAPGSPSSFSFSSSSFSPDAIIVSDDEDGGLDMVNESGE